MQIEPLSKHVGAEIKGVDVAALSDGAFEKVEDAYNRYSVLVFRDQKLTPEQHIAFARRFGDLEISPRTQFALPGHPEVLVLSNIIENGRPIGNADAGRTWHTDMSYTKTPPRGSILYAREIPIENGRALGDTVFSSAAAAFESLPANRRASLVGLRAIHRGSAKKYAPGSKLGDLVKDIPDVEHPVIRTHPVTGRKAIYVREGECVAIPGMPDDESLTLIKELGEMVTRAEFCYRHNWRLGDLLMWDNSMTQHLAISDYALPLRRLMHRVTVNGTVPI
jgi:taurine dioxygenase